MPETDNDNEGDQEVMDQSDAITAQFKKFDKDGNGKITQKELGDVLKKLSADWDDEKVTALLKGADKDNDGAIDMMEFINWIFSGDKELKRKAVGESNLRKMGV